MDSSTTPPAAERLTVIYRSLRQMAARRLAAERRGHTLQATALVHEVYLKLAGQDLGAFQNAAEFYAIAANAMRQVLVDHARGRRRVKRGGNNVGARVPLTAVMEVATLADDVDPDAVLDLDEAFGKLESANPDAAAVVRLRFFAGLSVEQTATSLGISERTAQTRWNYAKAWLFDRLTRAGVQDQSTELPISPGVATPGHVARRGPSIGR